MSDDNELLADAVDRVTTAVAECWDQLWTRDDAVMLLDGFLEGRVSFRVTHTGIEILVSGGEES
jgi:hypothetical protein